MKRLGMFVVVALVALALAAPSASALTERQQDVAITKLKKQVRVLTTRVDGLGGRAAAVEARAAALERQAAVIVSRASALEAYVVNCLTYGAYGVAQFSDFQSYYGGYTTGLDYAIGPDFYALAVNPACVSSSSAQASALADEASDLRWHVKLLRAGAPR